MKVSTSNFNIAYDSYYRILGEELDKVNSILEIGGGAHPSIQNRSKITYAIIDPDQSELDKAPEDIIKIKGKVQTSKGNTKYDLIISKMVLEHVENPDSFHSKICDLLSKNGKVIHFFACRHSIPSFVNRFLPEFVGDFILKILKNRNLDESPKYKAHYKRTLGHTSKQIDYFQKMGYKIEEYHSFVGHKYLDKVPALNFLEKKYTSFLVARKLNILATVGLVVLSKK